MSEVLSRKESIAKFCFKSRRSIEIAQHLGLNVDHVRRYIREMIAEGTMSKLSDDAKPNNHGVRYIASGKPIAKPEPVRAMPATYNTGFTVMGVRL